MSLPAPLERARAWLARRWVAVLFVVAYVYAFPYFPAIRSANELPRAYLVMAMVDEGTFAIDTGVKRWGSTADVSRASLITGRKGSHYSNKAPGSSMLAIPGYLALEGWHAVVGGEPTLAEVIWVSRLTTGIIPSLLFLWLLWGFLARFTPSPAARAATLVGLGVGSMFFLYSILFISHPLSAVCAGGAWIAAVRAMDEPAGAWRLGVAGFAAGAALLVDYQAVFATVPVALWVVVRLLRWPRAAALRGVGLAVLGAAIPVAILFLYHWACFGSALNTGYEASQTFAHHHQKGFLGMDQLRWEAFVGSTVAPDNGLVFLWPMALLAIPGWVLMARRPEQRGHVAVTLAVAVIYILFISALNFWRGGWQVGPRYIMAMLPFLAPPIAVALAAAERWWWLRGAAVGVCLVGLVTYGLSAALYPYFPDTKFVNPVWELTLRLLVEGHAPWNLAWLVGLTGLPSMIPYLAVLAGLAAWAALPVRGTRNRIASAIVAVLVAAAIVGGYRAAGDGGKPADQAYRNRVQTMPS